MSPPMQRPWRGPEHMAGAARLWPGGTGPYRTPASWCPGVVPSPPSASPPWGVRWRCAGHGAGV